MTELQAHLDGRWAAVRNTARELLDDPRLVPSLGSLEEQRARTFDRLRMLAEAGVSRLGFPKEYGGLDDLGGSITGFEMLALGDLSLLVKAGVQFGLFGGAILHLGTERHHEAYLADVISVALPGCFAMTETGHGSDVAALRTTATYEDGVFVIETPDDDARKDYIGNAARDGRAAVVFAQLITAGEQQGVHAFVVPIRDSDGSPADGVRIEDCGPKAGLNGVDNGRLWFDGVRIPRENLLNGYGDVAADGTYSTPIENPTRRFFTMLGTLIQGRVSVAGGAGSATKVALAIAVRYAEVRRQFTAPGRDAEIVLLDYLAHQRRLLPALARTYALHFAQGELVGALHDDFADEERRRPLEARAAAIKAAATWHATATIQTCREACGGAGYLTENQFARLKADTDVFTTFEGDNTVLLQLVGKELLTAYRSQFGELDWLGTIRFVAEQTVDTVVEHTAAHRREAPARHGGPPPAPSRRQRRPVRHVQRDPGPPAARRPGARRPAAARGVRRRHRLGAGVRPTPARGGVRPVRAVRRGGRPGVVHRARAAVDAAQQGGDRHGRRAVRRAAPARDDADRRLRHPGRVHHRADRPNVEFDP